MTLQELFTTTFNFLSLFRIALLAIVLSLIADYIRLKEKTLFSVIGIALAFFVLEVLWLLNIKGFFASIPYYLIYSACAFIISLIVIAWSEFKGTFVKYFRINLIISLIFIVIGTLVSVFAPNVAASDAFPGFSTIFRVFIITHLIGMLLVAMYYAGEATEHVKANMWFFIGNRQHLIFALAFMGFAAIPDTFGIVHNVGLLVGTIFLVRFATRFRVYTFSSLEDVVFTHDREKALILDVLYQVSNAIAEEKESEEILELLTMSAVRMTEAKAGALFLVNDRTHALEAAVIIGLYPPVFPVSQALAKKQERVVARLRADKIPLDHDSYLGYVVQQREPFFRPYVGTSSKVPQTLRGIVDIDAIIAVPLGIKDQFFGVLSVINKDGSSTFSDNDFSLMSTLADQASISINNIRLYETIIEKEKSERDIALAGEIQEGLLPKKAPAIGGFDISSFSYAAKGVGGDYYDYYDLGGGRFGAIMVDVSGKGVPASLVMVMIRSIWRFAAPTCDSLSKAVTLVNDGIAEDLTEDRYATLFYLVYDTNTKKLHYSNAGHGPLALFQKKTGEYIELDTEGIPVGITPGVDYEDAVIDVEPGDIAILYTDGVTEAMNMERDQYSLEALMECVKVNAEKSAQEITDTVYNEFKTFAGEAPQHDDETLMIMKIL